MRTLITIFIDLLCIFFKLLRRNGTKTLLAESLLLRHQLKITVRASKRAPHLNPFDRFFMAFLSLFMNPRRIVSSAIIIKPSTLLKFHRSLVKRKYSELFSPKRKRKPGPKGPTQDYIIPGIPPPISAGIPALDFSFGLSAIIAAVVSSSPTIDPAFWIAHRTTFVGSITPASVRSS